MTAKKTTGTVVIDGETYDTETVDYKGTEYVIRELGVDEGDKIDEASVGPDKKWDGKLNMRMSLSAAIVSPSTSIDQMGKWPGKKYVTLARAFNRLNVVQDDAPKEPASDETSG